MTEKKRTMKKRSDEKCINRVNIFDSTNVNVAIHSKNIYTYLFIISMLHNNMCIKKVNFVHRPSITYYCDF